MATCSVRYSKSKIRGQKHPREVVKSRNSIPNIKVNTQQAKIVNIRYRTTSAREGQATTGHPFPHQQTHNYMLRPISRIQTHSYIYTRTNYHECPSQNRGRQEEIHWYTEVWSHNKLNTVRLRYNTVHFLKIPSQQTPHSSPDRAKFMCLM